MPNEQIIHDFLMDHRPDGAEHDPVSCVHCKQTASHQEEDMSDNKMLTHDQHEELLASAVQKAKDEVRTESDAEILAVNEELAKAKAMIEELQAKLDEAKAEIEQRDEASRIEALASERAKLVASVASFSEEQIEKRRIAWAKMEEEDFNALVEDYRSIATAVPMSEEPAPKFDGTRETASEEEGFVVASLFKGQ